MKQRKSKAITEFGDFQTPPKLAQEATKVLSDALSFRPKSILEPTCGQGAFVVAAAREFGNSAKIIGLDINEAYLRMAAEILPKGQNVDLIHGDFFTVEWKRVLNSNDDPWLVIGNPPWVTSAELGVISGANLPEKSNFQRHSGMDAITGKANFDISEWMLLRYLDWLEKPGGAIAILCKTAVARKILVQAWKRKYPLRLARIYRINALASFGAAVEACFFVLEIAPGAHADSCDVFENLHAHRPSHTLGFSDGHVISNWEKFKEHSRLLGKEHHYIWRSGIKHDCSKVMELLPSGYDVLENGLGERVHLEGTYLFPMLKSSDIGNCRTDPRLLMLVTQRQVGEDTSSIGRTAPLTWQYLLDHQKFLEKRGSSIYQNKPAFSVFGVGDYSFSPWKIAISGFYKKLRFIRIGPPHGGNPVVVDDTVNFLPCWSEQEAAFLDELLNSPLATEFLSSMIHWDEKRPITVDLLRRLNIRKLAAEFGREREYLEFTMSRSPLFERKGQKAA